MLLRLEKDGCFIVARKPSPNGPPKKYYKLSEAGRQKLDTFFAQWQELSQSIANVFSRKEDDHAG